jgi:predicted nucleotidyltransferase/biotin operon repressor
MGFLANPLDAALSSTSKVRLLRLLIEQDRPISGREAARLTGMSRTAILAAIEDLAMLGLIHRGESGRQFLCRANRDHKLIQSALVPLFGAESEWSTQYFKAVREALIGLDDKTAKPPSRSKSSIMAAWIFGSVATGEDEPGSDLDLFVLTRSDNMVEPVLERISDRLTTWQRQFGADIRPIVLPYEKALRQLRAGDAFLANALRSPRMIMGEIPRELAHGKANKNATTKSPTRGPTTHWKRAGSF